MSEGQCTCPIRPGMTKEELIEEIYAPRKNCCDPYFICPTLDREMRRSMQESYWRRNLKKKPPSTITQPPKRKRGAAVAITEPLDLSSLT